MMKERDKGRNLEVAQHQVRALRDQELPRKVSIKNNSKVMSLLKLERKMSPAFCGRSLKPLRKEKITHKTNSQQRDTN